MGKQFGWNEADSQSWPVILVVTNGSVSVLES
ncbi:hypothetical protein HBN54_004681 [Hymenobacter sp. 1B]|uniref:Uncharacterized protein n=1 Tax=Hymenobacter artigasi TaxID=2719616 RepID=A0ABX1HRJ5_9BACT|nr:hypothetical protein [Hymenobacter artigasi]